MPSIGRVTAEARREMATTSTSTTTTRMATSKSSRIALTTKMSGKTSSDATSSKALKGTGLLNWNELEEAWRKDNPWLVRGYRPLSRSYPISLRSILQVHNQTVNIHSHLGALLFFVFTTCVFWPTLSSRYSSATHEDVVVFGSFFAGAMACFFLSTAFHTFSSHSERVYEQWLMLDFVGIICLVAGSWVPGVYYPWYCERWIGNTYTSMIMTLAFATLLILCLPTTRTPAYAIHRTVLFLALGFFGFVPMTHAAWSFGFSQAHNQMGWWWFILEGVCYTSGAVAYAFKWPERYSTPGKYDILGASHQIFHFFVVAGALAHFKGIISAFDYNHNPLTRLCNI